MTSRMQNRDKGLTSKIEKHFIKLVRSGALQFLLKPFYDLIYHIYEKILEAEVRSNPLPKHIAIIPDGNRRWALKHGLTPFEGHYYGYQKIREVLSILYDLGINVVTVFAMSNENCLYRTEEEKRHLFKLLEEAVDDFAPEVDRYKVKVKVIGNLNLIPETLREKIAQLEAKTERYTDRILNIALCYGGRQDIVEAVKKIAMKVRENKLDPDSINEETISKHLSTAHLSDLAEPDLVIRTSGEVRISNFLLWQIAYSELYFCDVYWPDFRRIDLLRAIRSYQRRERRFGR